MSTYIGTDREVRLGDKGACTVKGGVPGTIIRMSLGEHGAPNQAVIRWPNGVIDAEDVDELHWVEPHHCIEVYLTNEMVELLSVEPFHVRFPHDSMWIPDILNAVRDAVKQHEAD